MTQTSTYLFEGTLQTTNLWLEEIQERLGWHDLGRAYHALQAVLHATRDRLSLTDAATLGTCLPQLVRGLYYEAWPLPHQPAPAESFMAEVADAFKDDPHVDPGDVARVVFQVLGSHVDLGSIPGIRKLLTGPLAFLWPGNYPGNYLFGERGHLQ